ncbi:hypothetical protein ACFW9D_08465 [Streptomyces sp. NPDC059524]|uniref:hypothetical protein n=1 Tax=Streptomyces sp. NPDC059524 TaxID=3346856 RepID=UPI0036BCD9EA
MSHSIPPANQGQMPPGWGPPPAAAQPARSSGRSAGGVVLCVLGALLLLGGSALAAHAYSNSRQTIANARYGLTLWKDEPVDRLFPKTIGGRADMLSGATDPKYAMWERLGISEETSCAKALDGSIGKTAKRLGCKAVLRATYVDPTVNTLATVALVVLPPEESRRVELMEFFEDHQNEEPGVRALPVPGTAAANWSDARRSAADLTPTDGEYLPYALAVTTGSVDGRVAGWLPGKWGEDDDTGLFDRKAMAGTAHDVARLFEGHIDDLRLEGVK